MDKELILEQIKAMSYAELGMRLEAIQEEFSELCEKYRMIEQERQDRRDRGDAV